MKTYSIERILELQAELDEFNSHPLKEIILTKDGEPVHIPEEIYEDWRFTGLSNGCFVEFEMWNPDSVEVEKLRCLIGFKESD